MIYFRNMPNRILYYKNFLSVLLLCLSSTLIRAQNASYSLSIHSLATIHQNIQRNTPFDVLLNPATASFDKGFSIGVCSEQKWGQKDIISGDISAVWATQKGTWALPIHIDKAASFSNSTPSLIYARKLAANIGLALQLGYNITHVEKYGSQQQLDTKLGMLIHVTNQLHIGSTLHNVQFWFKHNEQVINQPVSIACQISYEPSEPVLVQAILEKQQYQPTQVIAGIYYRFHKYVEVSAGINTEGHQFWGSGSFIWKTYKLGISTTIHPQLGVAPGLSFTYNVRNN